MRAGGSARAGWTSGLVLTCAWLTLSLASACGGSAATPQQPRTASTLEFQGSLGSLVPAAGLKWMVIVKPKVLLRDPALRAGVERLFPNARLDVFARNSGVDLRRLDTGLVADFGIGTLYLAEEVDVQAVRSAFLNRLASEPLTKQLGPGIVHVTGLIGITPQSFVSVSDRIAGVSVKDPTLTKIVGAFALKKLQKSPTALAGAALRTLPKSISAYPLQFYAPGPFSDEWARGAHGLLGQTLAIAVTGRIESSGWLDALVLLEGEYAPDSEQSVEHALATFRELAQSPLGRVLALDDPRVAPEITASSSEISLRARLPLDRLLGGLYSVVAANVWDLLDYTPRAPPNPIN